MNHRSKGGLAVFIRLSIYAAAQFAQREIAAAKVWLGGTLFSALPQGCPCIHIKSTYRWKSHLEPTYSRLRCSQITSDSLRKCIAKRKTYTFGKLVAKTPSNATINRELKLLCSAFNLAMKSTPPKDDSTSL